jgi:hypothetical protein
MNAVTGYRRLSILAIAALLAAGCGATPTPAPVASLAAVAPSPTTPSPTYRLIQTYPPTAPPPSPTAGPSEIRCRSDQRTDDTGFAAIHDEGSIGVALKIASLARADTGESLALPQPPPDFGWHPGFLVSGGEMRIHAGYYGGRLPFRQDITITLLEASLIAEGQPRVDLDARYEPSPDGVGTIAVVRVPKFSFRGTLRFSVEWRDECFVVAARGSTPVIVDPPSAIEGCPDRRREGWREIDALFDPPIRVGPLRVALHAVGQGKKRDLSFADPPFPYQFFDSATPTMIATPGETIHVSIPNPDIVIHARVRENVIAFRRAPLIRWLEGGWIHGNEPDAEIVFRSPLVDHGDGAFSFTVPRKPGRYAIEAVFDYDSQCSYGTAGFVVGVEVE